MALTAEEIKQKILEGKILFFIDRTERFMNGNATDSDIKAANYAIEFSKPIYRETTK